MTEAAPASAASAAAMTAMDMGLSEEEALLQQALAMSMNENEPKPSEEVEDSKPAAAAMDENVRHSAACAACARPGRACSGAHPRNLSTPCASRRPGVSREQAPRCAVARQDQHAGSRGARESQHARAAAGWQATATPPAALPARLALSVAGRPVAECFHHCIDIIFARQVHIAGERTRAHLLEFFSTR